jgi:predicted lipoprotein with Yx(FWY)xxD motif
MKRILLAAAAIAFASTVAIAAAPAPATKPGAPAIKTIMVTLAGAPANILADDKGMVLYTYDRDTKGAAAANCTGNCPTNWPPFIAPAGATASGDWTIVDGIAPGGMMIKQWAFKGMPIYYYVRDTMPNQVTGDNQGMVWHVIKM